VGAPEVGPPPVEHPVQPPSPPVREHPLLPALLTAPVQEQAQANIATYPSSPFVTDPTQGVVPYGGTSWPTLAPEPDYDAEWFRLGRRWAR
jgi:hypothetical protein